MGSGGKSQSNAGNPYGNALHQPPSYAKAGSSPYQQGGQYYTQGNTHPSLSTIPHYYGPNAPAQDSQTVRGVVGHNQKLTPMGEKYLQEHPEVAEQGLHPWYHWLTQGSEMGYDWGTAPEPPQPINMGGGGGGGGPSGPSPEEVAAQEKRNSDLMTLDQMWGARYDAANSAVDTVDNAIEQERQQAAVLGLDYSSNKDLRRRRIELEFGNFWSSQDEDKLHSLAKQYGNPEQTESERALIESGDKSYEWDYGIYLSGGGTPKATSDTEKMAASGSNRSVSGMKAPSGGTTEDEDKNNPLGL